MFNNLSSYIKLLELLACIAAWLAWPQLKKSNSLKYFPFLLSFIVVYEFVGYFLKQIPIDTIFLKSIAHQYNTNDGEVKFVFPNTWWYNLCLPLCYLFYFFILHRSLESKVKKRILKWLSYAYAIYFLISTFRFYSVITADILIKVHTSINALGIIVLGIGLIFKIQEMVTAKDDSDIFKQPFFYILSALLFYHLISLPYYDLLNWFGKNANSIIKSTIDNTKATITLILYITYTIVFLWMKKKGTYS